MGIWKGKWTWFKGRLRFVIGVERSDIGGWGWGSWGSSTSGCMEFAGDDVDVGGSEIALWGCIRLL